MDDIRGRLERFSSAELALLEQRQTTVAMLRRGLLALICGSLLAALLLAATLAYATRSLLANLRSQTQELEAEIKLRRDTENTLRQAQKMEAVGQLTGGIAHDFNNLLTVILGNLDIMRRRLAKQNSPALTEALARPLDLAQQGGRNAAQLTHRLLAFSRKQALEPKPLDLNRLVAGMSELLRRTLGETISFETVLAGGLWFTFADSNQLENALLNLCVNARDAMPQGGRLTIETANAYLDDAYVRQFGDVAPGQYLLVCVADSGTGMAPEVLAKVFEPFFTTKPVGVGTGLGLAMVHGFVKQSGGHVRVYSELGHGTTVKIYLPRHQASEQPAAPAASQDAGALDNPRARDNETVLVAEDNDGVREYCRSALEELGYCIIEARDGVEALRIVGSPQPIDLLFTDVVMPGMTGRELATKALLKRPSLTVLYTTGYTRNAIVHQGKLNAGVELLSKPYTQQALARKIRDMLDRIRKAG
jgi:signal transduction histidine kinase/ActR/RegA family two-component response regulator